MVSFLESIHGQSPTFYFVQQTAADQPYPAPRRGQPEQSGPQIMKSGRTVRYDRAAAAAAALEASGSELFKSEKDVPLSGKADMLYHRLISTVLAHAEKEMLVPYNAAAKAVPPKIANKDPNYFQPA